MDEEFPFAHGIDSPVLFWLAATVAAIFVLIVLSDHFALHRRNRPGRRPLSVRRSQVRPRTTP